MHDHDEDDCFAKVCGVQVACGAVGGQAGDCLEGRGFPASARGERGESGHFQVDHAVIKGYAGGVGHGEGGTDLGRGAVSLEQECIETGFALQAGIGPRRETWLYDTVRGGSKLYVNFKVERHPEWSGAQGRETKSVNPNLGLVQFSIGLARKLSYGKDNKLMRFFFFDAKGKGSAALTQEVFCPSFARQSGNAAVLGPKPFLAEMTGKAVIVKLKWGMEYRGKTRDDLTVVDHGLCLLLTWAPFQLSAPSLASHLAGFLKSVDSYMNVQLINAEEWIDGAQAGPLGEVLIRCVAV